MASCRKLIEVDVPDLSICDKKVYDNDDTGTQFRPFLHQKN